MSLINNVLNELEKNKDHVGRHLLTLAGMTPGTKKQGGAMRWKLIYWLIIIAIVLSITWHYYPQIITTNQVKIVATLKKRFPAMPFTKKVEPVVPKIKIQPQPPIVKLQNVILEQKNNQTVLDFVLSGPTPYYIEHNSEQQLSITLSNTGVSGNLPVSLENSFISSLNTKQNNNAIISTVTVLPGTKIEELQLIDQPDAHLHLVLSNPQLTDISLSKVPIPLSPEEQALERYQEVQQLLAQNKNLEAIQKLYLFIGDFPYHSQARVLLVSLLIKDGRLQKANDVLMVGLNKYGDYSPFIKLRAHILIKQNKNLAAIDLLQKHVAEAVDDIEYLAILASLYQQQGSFMASAELYNQLTKIQPEKAPWWLGLGIALKSAGKANAAKEAFRHARDTSDVSSELSTFLDDEIKK